MRLLDSSEVGLYAGAEPRAESCVLLCVRRLLLLLPLLMACASQPPPDGLTRDRYVRPVSLPDPVLEERARVEKEWPPVDGLTLSRPLNVRRVRTQPASSSRANRRPLPAELPLCGTPEAEGRPCKALPDGSNHPVILRAEASGYSAPRLTFEER